MVTIETDTVLQVHHKFYILSKYPWDYEDESLITYCSRCHKKEHEQNSIAVYFDERMIDFKTLTPCNKCGGSGYLKEYEHVKNGVCFRCNGSGFDDL